MPEISQLKTGSSFPGAIGLGGCIHVAQARMWPCECKTAVSPPVTSSPDSAGTFRPLARFGPMWFVRYRRSSSDPEEIEEADTLEQAVDTACLLTDERCQVSAIGWGSLTVAVSAGEIERLYTYWKRAKAG
jgi:hypothetical protein